MTSKTDVGARLPPASNEEPGTDKEDERHRDLGDHQRAAPPHRRGRIPSCSSGLERSARIGPRALHGGDKSKDTPREQSEGGREDQGVPVE
jgi:hypothetical protein